MKNTVTPNDHLNQSNLGNQVKLKGMIISLSVVCLPMILLLTVGKDRLFGGDYYFMEFYFSWVVFSFVTLLIRWKSGLIIEKLLLLLVVLFLIYMTFYTMYETKRNYDFRINTLRQSE